MIDMKFDMFLDRPGVEERVGKKRTRALARTGGYVAKTVQRSIRPAGKKGKKSAPGEPPRGHQGGLRDQIYFGLDPATESVVIAPLKFASQPKLIGAASVPDLLEYGGTEVFYSKGQTHSVDYAPRPFIEPQREPALEKLAKEIESTPL